MINYAFKYKAGDREAEKITDDLILSEAMAKARAIQELCELFKIIVSKELRTTVSTDLEIGQSRYFEYPKLGIAGDLWVISIDTTLSRNGSYEDITLHSYKDMP